MGSISNSRVRLRGRITGTIFGLLMVGLIGTMPSAQAQEFGGNAGIGGGAPGPLPPGYGPQILEIAPIIGPELGVRQPTTNLPNVPPGWWFVPTGKKCVNSACEELTEDQCSLFEYCQKP